MYDDGSTSPLLRQFPRIRRARDYRLYTDGYKRYVDLWQTGGYALLGHTVPGCLREMKNTASRGLSMPLPHFLEARFEKAVLGLFPGRSVRLYKDKKSLESAFEKAGFERPGGLPDPALGQTSAHHTLSLWRPFLDPNETVPGQADILLPLFPAAWMNCPWILLVDKNISGCFPASDVIPPLVLSVLTASVHGLVQQIAAGPADYSGVTRELTHTPWKCRGIYLVNQEIQDDAAYERLFFRFLDKGFLIPPKRGLPLILPARPGFLSPGELAALKNLLKETSSGDKQDPTPAETQ